jgi:hypothetical protein
MKNKTRNHRIETGMRDGNKEHGITIIRSGLWNYLLFGFMFLIALFLGITGGVLDIKKDPTKLIGIVLFFGSFAMIVFWFLRFRVEISGEKLSYRAPFSQGFSVIRSDVVGVVFDNTRIIGKIPNYQMKLSTRGGGKLILNTKPFTPEDIDKILKFLRGV